eukprot:7601715-Karenia_brevis.AAC.1
MAFSVIHVVTLDDNDKWFNNGNRCMSMWLGAIALCNGSPGSCLISILLDTHISFTAANYEKNWIVSLEHNNILLDAGFFHLFVA